MGPAAAIVVAYVMYVRDMDSVEAVSFVQMRRQCATPTNVRSTPFGTLPHEG